MDISKKLEIEINYNINPNPKDISRLIEIQHIFLNSDYSEIIINFTDITFINAAVAVVIGTLCVYAKEINKKVRFKFKNESQNSVFKFMKQVGIYEYFVNTDNKFITDYAIPFDQVSDEDAMEAYVDKIMALAPVMMEAEAQDILASYFYEIYQNALVHAESPIGVFSSGYWLNTRKELIFSIYDMGIGIPNNIRLHIDEKMSDKECLEWAFTEGKSTIEEKLIKRGLGLSQLKKFIRLNKGKLIVYSGNCCYTVTETSEDLLELHTTIKGTLIIINIIADTEHIYIVS